MLDGKSMAHRVLTTEKTSHDKSDDHEDGICQRKPDHRRRRDNGTDHGHDTDTSDRYDQQILSADLIGTVPEKSSPDRPCRHGDGIEQRNGQELPCFTVLGGCKYLRQHWSHNDDHCHVVSIHPEAQKL